ncbi:cell wall integrity and stress response component 1-like, partial [Chiloscyllium plagiosum]|uniref:cell wall integrity and stress response component 1-like n=1 Tax=Chiloscyllium plagiosum TaxID=36176 RepID=UPI001CB84639
SLQRIALTVQRAKWDRTGVQLPIRVYPVARSRIAEGLWALLLSIAHFLLAVVKMCRQALVKNRRVDQSPGELPEIVADLPLGLLSHVGLEDVPGQCDGVSPGHAEPEEDRHQAFSIYLPQNSRQYWHLGDLQGPESPSSLGPSTASSSSSSALEGVDGEASFPSSSSSRLSDTSSRQLDTSSRQLDTSSGGSSSSTLVSSSSCSSPLDDNAQARRHPFTPGPQLSPHLHRQGAAPSEAWHHLSSSSQAWEHGNANRRRP